MTRRDEPPSRAYLVLAILFLLWLAVASSADAQTVLTVNGQCVPTTCSSGPPTPPTCSGGQVWNGSACACPSGQSWTGSACITPPPPSENCLQTDAPAQLGGNPPIQPTTIAASQVVAFRIQAKDIANKGVGVYQPSASMTVAVSATPCDLGPPVATSSGCYITAAGANPQQILLRVAGVNGYLTCKQPPGDPLYINVAFTGYPTFTAPITNFCIAAGKTHCSFQFRRDS